MSPTQPDGYLVMPQNPNGRAVLVLHAWWGLNDTIKSVCTRLAEQGFIAFAPDLYHGKLADTIEEAETLSASLLNDLGAARADLVNATTFLTAQTGISNAKLAVMGFSLGAFAALDLSVTNPETFQSVVIFYGTRPGNYSPAQADFLGHFAETDEFEPLPDVYNLEKSLKDAGCNVEFHYYSNTGHWFFEPDRVLSYHPASADLAWERTLAFLKRNPSTTP